MNNARGRVGITNMKCAEKPRHDKIIFPDGFPVKITWARGKYSVPYFLTYHRELEFHYIKRGEGSYFIKDHNYPFKKNSLLAINANEIHRFVPRPDSHIEKATLTFVGSSEQGERRLARLPADFPSHIPLSEEEATSIEVLLNSISREARRKQRYWQEIIRLKLKEFFLLVKRGTLQKQIIQPENPHMHRLVNYIEENFTQELTLAFLAEQFALSPSHLSRLFKEYTGVGLKQHILQRRIIEAKRMLEEDPALKVRLIAARVGFKDTALFSRDFKLITGFTASTYRKISQQADKKEH